jgi:TatD DNase family protein
MRFVDSHCHLTFAPLSQDLPGVLDRARARGVTDIVVPAYDLASWDAVQQLGRQDGVHPALGLHPWVADERLDAALLERRLREIGAVAVGEIGLDAKVDVPLSRQADVFEQQLTLAARLGLPVLLHCRGAFDTLLEMVDKTPGVAGVVHAFSRGPELAAQILDRGLYLAFGGAITRPRAHRARRAAHEAPRNRILLETDAPSIGLEGVPPAEVEPAHVADIAAALAETLGEPIEAVAGITTKNAKALFGFR